MSGRKNVNTPTPMPTSPASTSCHERQPLNASASAWMPSMIAQTPNTNTSAASAASGCTSVSTPKMMASTPRRANSHQWAASALIGASITAAPPPASSVTMSSARRSASRADAPPSRFR